MTHDELARRKPLWETLSDLFLDTETRWDLGRFAKACAVSGYDDEALERVFWGEVFPEALHNLLTVAGDWVSVSMNEQELIRRANHPSIPWLSRRAHGWMVEKEWLATRQVTKWFRAVPKEEWDGLQRALDLLGRRYFEDPARESGTASPKFVAPHVERMRAEWPRFEPVLRALRHDEEAPHDACAAAVRALLST